MNNITFSNEEIEILKGTDIEKQKELVKIKVDNFEGTNIEDFFWICINVKKSKDKHKQKEIVVYKRPKDDSDDEKKMETNSNKTESLSMLIDFKLAKLTDTKKIKSKPNLHVGRGMCPKGDVWFIKDWSVCMECESEENVMKCGDCEKRDNVRCVLCKNCRYSNVNKLENESKMDNIKREVIRKELQMKPSLSLDILCGMPRKMAMDKLMKDIMQLEALDRGKYSLFLVDMDNLKALNSVLSHQGADEVIKHVGLTLKKWCLKVNKGQIRKLEKAWCFRQGGDEFCMVVRSKGSGCNTSFNDFVLGWKEEINGLVNSEWINKYKPSKEDMKEGMKTLKERKMKKIETALSGIILDERIKKIISDAVDHMEISFDLQKIGISVGLFVAAQLLTKEKDWIKCAEIAQDAAKDIKGKNSISIYYEVIKGVVPQNKTE
eukprot:532955_1